MDENTFKRKRGSLKASLTNFVKYVQGLKQKEEALGNIEIANLRERLARLESVFIEFQEVQTEIELITDEARLDEQYIERENFYDRFYESIAISNTLLPIQEHGDQSSDEFPSRNSNNSRVSGHSKAQSNSKSSTQKIAVKLPDIPLPTFDGSFKHWLEFKDTFESLINKNPDLTEIQKFHYLRASLVRKASEVIKSVEFSEKGYPVAWNALIDRFDNKKLLMHNHLRAIFSLDNVIKEGSAKIRGLIDNFSKHLSSLNQLGQDTSNWDTLLIYILNSKLEQKTVIDWEKKSIDITSPSLDDFLKFLKNRAEVLETIEYKSSSNQNRSDPQEKRTRSLVVGQLACYFCNKEHSIYSCASFGKLSSENKMEFIKKNRLCVNCLRNNHYGKRCKMGPCKKCKLWHNSLLHPDSPPSEDQQLSNSPGASQSITAALSKQINHSPNNIFLSTAIIRVHNLHGIPIHVRALLDCGSQSSFISAEICDRLGLKRLKSNVSVLGIGNLPSSIKNKCEIEISSLHSNFKHPLTCFILPQISSISYSSNINVEVLNIPSNLQLADPEFLKPGPIDILIGAELFWILLGHKRISCGKNMPFLQETKLGWILAGMIGNVNDQSSLACCLSSTNFELQKTLSNFWEIEEAASEMSKPLSQEEIQCERIFLKTTRRDDQGRFIVTLPLKQEAKSLGSSREQAEKRFYSLERKLAKNIDLREHYVRFMQEYEHLNHMTQCDEHHDIEYFMPHHGVIREASLTTKLRVVFDASAQTSNGISLNNIELVGPVLQNDLMSILLRFRKHAFVISADVEKMYRQVLVEPSQRKLQKIFWRYDSKDDLKSYTLNTVTYGHASASFLAIRCLFELANECEESQPEIASIIRQDFYVDDMLTGASTIEQAQFISSEVSKVLKAGGFYLRKWYSNDPEVVRHMQASDTSCGILEFSHNETANTLGLTWSCQRDLLVYNVETSPVPLKCTKRSILSSIARIFDPLGLLSPSTILAKMLIQQLWSEKLSWDDPLPSSLANYWSHFRGDLINLNKLQVNRRAVFGSSSIQLHGFADASEKAYGACVYLRSVDKDEMVRVSLLCAKSKVAPIKTLTIPKLELCAALLLARLVRKVVDSLQVEFEKCVLWSDSTINLAWLRTSPNTLKIFVGNRVAEVQTLTKNCDWRYVPSEENPADLVSRGLLPSQLLTTPEWWQGPLWLAEGPMFWPTNHFEVNNLPELKAPKCLAFLASIANDFTFDRFSSLPKLIRVTAYLLRFKINCSREVSERITTPISMSEMRKALRCLLNAAQRQSFPEELTALMNGHQVKPNSKLSSLNPFLDSDNLIHVGGRLKHSDFPHEKKYPIVLHSGHHLTKLIFEHEHVLLLHPGPQLLLSCVREKYWPIAGRSLARAITRKCLRCFRFAPSNVEPLMGDLPRERTAPMNPFHVTGIDYAGPFLIRRNRNTVDKCYIGVFVCLSTKALHLELISSLSSQAFIQSLRRFVSRRGKPLKLLSDNGTTFVGANKELGQFLKSNQQELEILVANERIEWSFIPPYSPHFGGLWEAGVKSVKHHLKRVLANARLNFEEFNTILCQIEAILNSRPLSPLSSDPNDLLPLTPAHFLIGRPLVAVPEPSLQNVPTNRLKRFQVLQHVCQHFWKRWEKEYISELQCRQKWRSMSPDQLKENTLVLIKEDHTLPTQWKLGRIVEVHPGTDGISRVASIKTSQGIVRRSFPKICPLPIHDDL